MKHLLIFFCLNLTLTTFAQSKTNTFPDAFLGVYKGNLKLMNANSRQLIKMELHLLKTDQTNEYDYTLVYGTGENRQERKYTLIKDSNNPKKFIIDENNGILLEAICFDDNTLYSMFEVSGNILTSTGRFHKDSMDFEITSSSKTHHLKSGGKEQDVPEVVSYPIGSVQKGLLIKEK